jgi:hypothetical protein
MRTLNACLASMLLCAAATVAQAAPVTAFYYTSSPSSWVGQGATVTVTPAEGFAFMANPTFDKGVSLAINDFQSNPDFQKARWWYLEFAAPFDALLSVGFYDNAMRWPFQDSDRPGLSFSGNGRGNNTLTGFFEVLEVAFDQAGSILRFAADFTQFDEGFEQAWNRGSIRFNSEIPLFPNTVPEPGPLLTLVALLAALGIRTLPRQRPA